MRRFAATVRRDMVLQYRNGLYAVSLFVVALFAGLLLAAPEGLRTDGGAVLWMPAFVVGNLMLTTFFFMAGVVLLERDEGTVAATVTTPLRDREYLGSKAMTLAALGLVENAAVVLLFFGWPRSPTALAAGILLCGGVYALLGFVSVAGTNSINEWLMPSMLWVTALLLPLLGHFGAVERAFLVWHPVEPMLVLLRAAYGSPTDTLLLYGWAGSGLWLAGAAWLARRKFTHWVVQGSGVAP